MSWRHVVGKSVLPVAALLALTVACEIPEDAFVHDMVFPVDGEASFTNTFGHPRSGGRSHEGQDIMSDKGTRIVAPEAGVVTWFVHSNSGSAGNALSVTTSDGWTYRFMHLNNDTPGTDDGKNPRNKAFSSRVEMGAEVEAGQLLGFVGDSGNAEATSPHLHFEMRKNNKAIDSGWSLVVAENSPYASHFQTPG